ncbi:MAG: hypothetical protein QNJ14_10450 [Woeseiaceae bacterium]|nr:hypothetical protein [Woeseiaceae bacterium]
MPNREYTADDFPALDVDAYLRERQDMFFGSRGANPESIASSIAEGALTLGARRTMVTKNHGWWFVCADIDWLQVPTVEGVDEQSVFDGLCAFPEAGINWHRSEVMIRVFSDQAFSASGERIFRVKDGSLSDDEVLQMVAELGSWDRVVGFHFTAANSEFSVAGCGRLRPLLRN